DPTGLLSDCHRRIDMFLRSLQHVAEVIDRPLTEEARSALESALRYFRESAPKHTADEEESLFPRLRQTHDPEIETALSTLDALEGDHRKAESLHAEVDTLGLKCMNQQCLRIAEANRFRQAVGDLAAIYEEHIRVEDEVVFPAAKLRLTGNQQLAIASEMATRRNLRP
ncbi:MAG TPA: hemerythrin domain-containing protein, partial [Terriglobales bacterium]|nr:hemerythrin domain-containing protein [Terriglobales bacterium]